VDRIAKMVQAIEAIDAAALDLIESTIECRLTLLRAWATAPAGPAPDRHRAAPLRMALTIRDDFDGCVPTDREIRRRRRGGA
jgi:hypothetical protein